MKPNSEITSKALLQRSDGRILTLTRAGVPHNDLYEGKIDLPGGAVDDGEEVETALLRELREETAMSISFDQCELIYCQTIVERDRPTHKFLYLVIVDNPEVVISDEHSGYNWLTIDELKNSEWTLFYADAIKYAIAKEYLV